jgi:hypothetical protein
MFHYFNCIERPESFDEFPARGLITLAEVWITKRTEQVLSI